MLFFLLVLFAIAIFNKAPLSAIFMLVFSCFIALFSVFYIKNYIDETIRKRDTSVVLVKKMNYSDTLLVDVNLTNLSKYKFKYCSIRLKFIKNGKNALQSFVYKFKPFYVTSQKLSSPLDLNETRKVNFLIKDFGYKQNDKIITDSECF